MAQIDLKSISARISIIVDLGIQEKSSRESILRSVFDDPRLRSFRAHIPLAKKFSEQVYYIVSYLADHHTADGEDALVLLLRILSKNENLTEWSRRDFLRLAYEIDFSPYEDELISDSQDWLLSAIVNRGTDETLGFENFDEGGSLEIEYLGEPLDLYSIGIFHTNVQDIVSSVAIELERLTHEDDEQSEYGPLHWQDKVRPSYRTWVRQQLIKSVPKYIKLGSLDENIGFLISILVQPDVRAILQNLAANIIWSISTSTVARATTKNVSRPSKCIKPGSPYTTDIGRNLHDILRVIADNNKNRAAQITFRYRSPSNEMMEISLTVDGKDDL